MKKRILSLLLALSLVCSLLPSVVLATDETFTYEVPNTNIVLSYQVNANDNVIITGCNGNVSGALEIPSIIDRKRVTSIGGKYNDHGSYRGAFYNCGELTSVTIPDSVTSIGEKAFYMCGNLTSVTIPNSVTSIGVNAFRVCGNLNNVTIPKSITRINSSTFSGCSSLTDITIPDSVTYIGPGAFSGCSSLTNITIPDSVTSIGYSAFANCTSLVDIKLSENITYIANNTFANCTALTSIIIPDSVTYFGGSGAVGMSGAFVGCTGLTSVILPNSIASTGRETFSGCSNLTNIIIPNSVTNIGKKTFFDCGKLTSITIPSSVTSIEEKALGYISEGSNDVKLNNFTINGTCKSAAETYATENGFTFNATHNITTIPAVPATCTKSGLTAGQKCAGCGEIITPQAATPALGHNFTGNYLNDETGHWHKCSRCDETDTKAAHSYNTTNCGEAANCTVCGYTKAAGTHTWNAGEVIKPATCTATGTMKYTCTSCGETKDETIPVSKHTPAQAWSSDGAGHWHDCTVCNQKIDSSSHTFGAWKTTQAATATTAGSRERVCNVCAYKQAETIPATGGGNQGGGGGGSIGGGGIVAPPAKEDETKEEEQPTTNAAVYCDVSENAWYNNAVNFVTEKGLMSGTGTNAFAPSDNLTRAMLAQILYNNEDKPATSGNSFSDVESGAWYTDAVTWAAQKGIVSGYDSRTFGPDDNITREQLAVMLWRYAGQPTSNAELDSFTDIDKASDYALTALRWAVEKGIISGKGSGTLDPTGNATRAEVAQMLMNYFK